jgi:hypothetical protein
MQQSGFSRVVDMMEGISLAVHYSRRADACTKILCQQLAAMECGERYWASRRVRRLFSALKPVSTQTCGTG